MRTHSSGLLPVITRPSERNEDVTMRWQELSSPLPMKLFTISSGSWPETFGSRASHVEPVRFSNVIARAQITHDPVVQPADRANDEKRDHVCIPDGRHWRAPRHGSSGSFDQHHHLAGRGCRAGFAPENFRGGLNSEYPCDPRNPWSNSKTFLPRISRMTRIDFEGVIRRGQR
jgi:hypothetical protein